MVPGCNWISNIFLISFLLNRCCECDWGSISSIYKKIIFIDKVSVGILRRLRCSKIWFTNLNIRSVENNCLLSNVFVNVIISILFRFQITHYKNICMWVLFENVNKGVLFDDKFNVAWRRIDTTLDWVHIASDNGLLHDDVKPLPQLMLTSKSKQ